jgi:NADPH-dependent 2,4-dienoyl-CoA reductase/sulfur reductase-like enzyme
MRIIVVAGVAGKTSAATRLRRRDADAEIVVLEGSGHVSYATGGLTHFVGVVIEDEDSLLRQTPANLLLGDLGFDVKNLDGGYQTWRHSPAALLEPSLS